MNTQIKEIISKQKLKLVILLIILISVLLLLFLLSINMGVAGISLDDVVNIIIAQLTGDNSLLAGISKPYQSIIVDIRLPRILSAILVGCGLAVSGVVFQALLMNPLASPYTMGVSSGAAFGAVTAIYLNLVVPGFQMSITITAFIGAISTLAMVMTIAKVKGYISSANLIIAGIIVSSILSAAISYIKSVSGDNVREIVYWLMGNLVNKDWHHVMIGFCIIIPCILVCMYYSHDLNIISFGDKEAKSLGIHVERVRLILLIFASLITAASVSIAGIIGFIGLIVPHMLRFIIGSNNKILIPLSALLGSILLLMADTGIRTLMAVEIPVGIITTLLGGPFFVYIFIKKNKTLY